MIRPLLCPRSRMLRWSRGLATASLAVLMAVSPAIQTAPARAQGSLPLLRDTEIEATLRADTDPILVAAGLEPKDVTIYLLGDKEINAMVMGGQNLFLNTGMIVRTRNPNELMGVIAHETGHIAGGHLARSDEGNKKAMATYILTMGLGMLAAVAGGGQGGQAGAGLMYSAGFFATLTAFGYTRVQESSADQAAAKYLEKAGYSGKGLVDFFSILSYQEVFADAKKYPYFVNHPLSNERIDALTARVKVAPHYNTVDSPEALERHRVMIAKIKAFTNYPQTTFQDYPETDTSYPARYARAIAMYKGLETDKALKAIDALISEQPQNPYLHELKGQVLFEAGRTKDAIDPFRRAVNIKPDAPLLHVLLAQTLLAQKGNEGIPEALENLTKAIEQEKGDNAMAWQLAGQAYDRTGNPGMARLATAEMHFSLGLYPQARDFARRARELLPTNTPEWRKATDIINISESSFEQAMRRGGRS